MAIRSMLQLGGEGEVQVIIMLECCDNTCVGRMSVPHVNNGEGEAHAGVFHHMNWNHTQIREGQS